MEFRVAVPTGLTTVVGITRRMALAAMTVLPTMVKVAVPTGLTAADTTSPATEA